MSEVKIRLGLLMRNGSIHLPDASSHARKNPRMIAVRMRVTVTMRPEKADFALAVVSCGAAVSERSLTISSVMMVARFADRCLARRERCSRAGHTHLQRSAVDEPRKY